jgi:hypothetical protein
MEPALGAEIHIEIWVKSRLNQPISCTRQTNPKYCVYKMKSCLCLLLHAVQDLRDTWPDTINMYFSYFLFIARHFTHYNKQLYS